MDKTTYVSEPASELERLITDLSGSGLLVFVFGDGFTAAHLKGVTTPLFADRPTGGGGTSSSATRRRAG